MEYPPQPGEVWINIHTSAKAIIDRIEDVKITADKTVKVVVYSFAGATSRCNQPDFLNNWKRHKSASKWHTGALGELK